MNKVTKSVVAALLTMGAAAANAGIVYDGWQLNDGAGYLTTNIGHLNLSGGTATVAQQLNSSGQLYVGASFSESGMVFTTTYTAENCVGACDSGYPLNYKAPSNGSLGLEFVFPTLTGYITNIDPNTGNISYAFNIPQGVQLNASTDAGNTWTTVATLDTTVPSGGGLQPFLGGGLANGTTDILFTVDPNGYQSNLFLDSSGNSLDPLVNAIGGSGLQLFVHTQNTQTGTQTISQNLNGTFTDTFTVQSDGSANLQRVPEPASILLMGVGMVGLGFVYSRRRNNLV